MAVNICPKKYIKIVFLEDSGHDRGRTGIGWRRFYKIYADYVEVLGRVLGTRGAIFCLSIHWIKKETNTVWADQKDFATQLNISQSQVSRALRDMEREGLVVSGRRWFMINPDLIHYGGNLDGLRRSFYAKYYKKHGSKPNIRCDGWK